LTFFRETLNRLHGLSRPASNPENGAADGNWPATAGALFYVLSMFPSALIDTVFYGHEKIRGNMEKIFNAERERIKEQRNEYFLEANNITSI